MVACRQSLLRGSPESSFRDWTKLSMIGERRFAYLCVYAQRHTPRKWGVCSVLVQTLGRVGFAKVEQSLKSMMEYILRAHHVCHHHN